MKRKIVLMNLLLSFCFDGIVKAQYSCWKVLKTVGSVIDCCEFGWAINGKSTLKIETRPEIMQIGLNIGNFYLKNPIFYQIPIFRKKSGRKRYTPYYRSDIHYFRSRSNYRLLLFVFSTGKFCEYFDEGRRFVH